MAEDGSWSVVEGMVGVISSSDEGKWDGMEGRGVAGRSEKGVLLFYWDWDKTRPRGLDECST
jgi:hypothetical protein